MTKLLSGEFTLGLKIYADCRLRKNSVRYVRVSCLRRSGNNAEITNTAVQLHGPFADNEPAPSCLATARAK
jgi:hypothetical protein